MISSELEKRAFTALTGVLGTVIGVLSFLKK
jgi:hypothetical protein